MNHIFLLVGARVIFLIKLATKIFIIAHTSLRMGVLQMKNILLWNYYGKNVKYLWLRLVEISLVCDELGEFF
jgi:hypothetical protein